MCRPKTPPAPIVAVKLESVFSHYYYLISHSVRNKLAFRQHTCSSPSKQGARMILAGRPRHFTTNPFWDSRLAALREEMERSSCRVAQNQVIKRLVTTWPCFAATQRLMHRQPVALSPKRLEASSMPSQVGSYIVKSTITTLPKSGNMAPLKDFLLHSCIVIPALIVLYIFSRFLH